MNQSTRKKSSLARFRRSSPPENQQDCDQVFYYESSEHDACPWLLHQPEVSIGLDYHHGRGHGEESAQECGLHACPPEHLPEQESEHENAKELGSCSDKRLRSRAQKLLEAEFQAKPEHQEDDSDFGPLVDGRLAHDPDKPEVRADQEASDYVSEDERLLESAAEDCEYAGGDQDQGQVVHEIDLVVHILSLSEVSPCFRKSSGDTGTG